jgi:hypothetical protein
MRAQVVLPRAQRSFGYKWLLEPLGFLPVVLWRMELERVQTPNQFVLEPILGRHFQSLGMVRWDDSLLN